MTKQATKQSLIKKINQLNKRIDVKIALDEDFKKEAKQHYKLLTAIKALEK